MANKRQDSLLTDGQRRFLNSDGSGHHKEAGYHRTTVSDYRTSIRERVPEGIRDGKILWDEWDEWDENARMEMFEENLGDSDFEEGLVGLLALIYSGTGEAKFRNLLQRGIRRAENRARNEPTDRVRVEFNVDTIPTILVENALERYRSRGELHDMSDSELAAIATLLRRYMGAEAAKQAEAALEKREERIWGE